jgi:hypothetical protein
MSENLHSLEAGAGELPAQPQSGQRRVVTRKIAQDLRRSQAQRIASQRALDGATYPAQKKRKDL